MMIIDPVTLGDVSCTRASVKYVFDRTGTLVQVPANTLAVTYDPSDLSKAPYALVEGAATNLCRYSDSLTGPDWVAYYGIAGGAALGVAPDGSAACGLYPIAGPGGTGGSIYYGYGGWVVAAGDVITASFYVKAGISTTARAGIGSSGAIFINTVFDLTGTQSLRGDGWVQTYCGNGWFRISFTYAATGAGQVYLCLGFGANLAAAPGPQANLLVWRVQIEAGSNATSPIFTNGAPVTRAADVIAPGAGLVYSNVAITETPYNSGSTYAKDVVVYDPATYLTYQSLIANNVGRALSDTGAWTPLKLVVNQRLMLDQYNNTQTSNAEEIIIVLSPRAIAQGIYLGNVDATEVRISSVDLTAGLVYQEVQSLLVSTSGGSFYNWCFKRWKKRSYAVSVQAPPYANCLVTIAIKKPGGIAKCGMCVLGPLVDVGLAQYGLSREITDYSTVNFNFDGTSNVILRNFAKIMDVDLVIDNDQIDSVIEALEGYRQKPVAWIGTALYGSACLFGTYTNFKNVISYPTQSNMSLQIKGTV